MSLPAMFGGLSEVRGAMAAAMDGRLLDASPTAGGASDEGAAVAAMAVSGLAAAGQVAGLGALREIHVKGPGSATVTGIARDAFVLVHVDPARPTAQVERALDGWAHPDRAATAPAAPSPVQVIAAKAPRPAPTPTPAPAPPRAAPPPAPVRAVPPASSAPPPAPAAAAKGAVPRPAATAREGDPWAAVRRALGRAQLSEAVLRQRELPSACLPGRQGSEPIGADECERAMQTLLSGIGSVMAGDGVGGGRVLGELASATRGNLSFRWLALFWGARAALRSGSLPAARAHVQSALTLAQQLDIDARALTQWTAAEILAFDSDPSRALAWLHESRGRFVRVGDPWGVAQTFLAEARILAATKREAEAAEAAAQAAAALPDSDEPTVLLARLALMRDDLSGAEQLLAAVRSQAGERVRALVDAIRGGVVGAADASEFLREQDAPPSPRALRALERIASNAPRFVPARETRAWMLLRLGRYEEAHALFRGLLAEPLGAGDRASVMLGLGCVANARGAPADADADAGAAAAAGEDPRAEGAPAAAPPAGAPPPRPAAAGSDAVFQGQLSSFALPDLLEFLRSARRTGMLVCTSTAGIGTLRLRDGWLAAAAAPGTPRVGPLLAEAGALPPQALDALHRAHGPDQPDAFVAEQLLRAGAADAAALRAAFERQIDLAVRELVGWKDGEFVFNREAAPDPEPAGIAVSLDPQAVMLNLFKDQDEASRGEPPPDVLF